MKDINEIIKQFDDIEELSVSEEMLGAYVEGKLNSYEMDYLANAIQSDGSLQDLSENIVSDVYPLQIDRVETNDIEYVNSNYESLYNEKSYADELGDFNDVGTKIEVHNSDLCMNDYDGYDYGNETTLDDSLFDIPIIPF